MSGVGETCAACGKPSEELQALTAWARDCAGARCCNACMHLGAEEALCLIRARRTAAKPGPGEEWLTRARAALEAHPSATAAAWWRNVNNVYVVIDGCEHLQEGGGIEAIDISSRGSAERYIPRAELLPTPYQPKPGDLVRVVESFFPEAIGQTMRFEREDDAGQWVLAEIDPSPFRHSRFYMRKEVTRLEPAERKQGEPTWTKAFVEKDAEIRARQATDPYRTYNTRNPESVVALDTVLADAKRFDALSPLQQRRELHKRALLEALDRKSVGHPWESWSTPGWDSDR